MRTIKLQDLSDALDTYERKDMRNFFSDLVIDNSIFLIYDYPVLEIREYKISAIENIDDCNIKFFVEGGIEILIKNWVDTSYTKDISIYGPWQEYTSFVQSVATNFFICHRKLKEICEKHNEIIYGSIVHLGNAISEKRQKIINLNHFN